MSDWFLDNATLVEKSGDFELYNWGCKDSSHYLYYKGKELANIGRPMTLEKWLSKIYAREEKRVKKIDETIDQLEEERAERMRVMIAITDHWCEE